MKLFWLNCIVKINKLAIAAFFLTLFSSCATHKPQYGAGVTGTDSRSDTITEKPVHTLFLIGDAGYANEAHTQELFSVIREKFMASGKNTSLFFLGDNVYPAGMPDKDERDRKDAEGSLDSQIKLAKSFEGKTFFIPGNHDWYHGLKGLEEQNDYIEEKLDDNKSFLPGKGCGIDDIDIDDNTIAIVIDSQWFIEDWDDYPTINDDCDIKTREALFMELESELNKNQDKTIILAIHHPLMSSGTHGGYFSAEKQLFPLRYNVPLPIIGSLINMMRKASGYSTQDLQSRVYSTLADRIKTMLQERDNVIVISGHDHNLQYIHKDNIHQVISGAGSKMEAAKAVNPHDFSYGGTGYATVELYKDGSAKASFFGVQNGKEQKLFETRMLEKRQPVLKDYPDTFPAAVKATVYEPDVTQKSKTYRFLFGEHYRPYYGLPVEAETVLLDTLKGGLKPVRAGGGHQSKSLRLKDKDGKEYVMRGLKKSASRFLQAAVFEDQYIGDSFNDTYAEEFLMDFYTTGHPYAAFIIDDLSESAGVFHTNPKLYYMPKQDALEEFNEEYGNELYMFEERPVDEHNDLESFGKPDAIEGTDDVMENLREDSKYEIDERAYIRARLFDFLIGDWDRHTDQWRWGRYDGKDNVVYKPIPRDRDQAFTKYGGALLSLILKIPALRHMQTFDDDINNIKWFNREPYAQDLAFITRSGEDVWMEEAAKLRENLTDEAIDEAFTGLPKEIRDDETTKSIKANLKIRKQHLEKYVRDYRAVLLKTVVLTGTDKKERFIITRMPGGETEVRMYSLSKEGKEFLKHTKVYNRNQTKEIWIYGLDDDDSFEVKGDPENAIIIRLLGGQNHDIYNIENGKKIKVYDFKSKENTYKTDRKTKLVLTDDYETNSYDLKKPDYNVVAGYPMAGYNPDDGVKLGVHATFTINNFIRRPYTQKHSLEGNYYFATNGFELGYRGRFMNLASRWNFGLDVWYTSPNFSISYFGYGNETENYDEDFGKDFNRVKLQVFRVAPSLFRETRNGVSVAVQVPFETIEIDGTNDRFINREGVVAPYLFEHRQYAGVNGKFSFANYDNASLPALGMGFDLSAGWTGSLQNTKQNFPHFEGCINLVHRITRTDDLVFATRVKSRIIFNNDFEFYQGATLGGDNDLRAYRRERFTGKTSFSQSSDLRLTLGTLKAFVPMKYGILGGFDYGRVWINDDTSEKWHNSVGGALWLNAANTATVNVSYFYGEDGGRLSAGLTLSL